MVFKALICRRPKRAKLGSWSETEYLLSTSANARRLRESIAAAEAGETTAFPFPGAPA